jgi:hypothetical protein
MSLIARKREILFTPSLPLSYIIQAAATTTTTHVMERLSGFPA